MKVHVLGSFGGSTNVNRLTSFLIDDMLALDAGCITHALSLDEQVQVSDILLSHSHLDHLATIPFLIDNQFGKVRHPLTLWGPKAVMQALKDHLFNNVIWPDFTTIQDGDRFPVQLREIEPEQTFQIKHLTITSVRVNHIVECFGYLVTGTYGDRSSTLIYTADTGPTDRIWALANQATNLAGIIVDCSFPNHMDLLARESGHMTAALLGEDLKKLKASCPVFIYHPKPGYEETIWQELQDLNLPFLHLATQNSLLTL